MRTNYRTQNFRNVYKINAQIYAKSMRVIDETGKQIGILDRDQALTLAREKEVDLVEIAPKANPPVAKLIDYKKFLYQLKKKKQEEKKKTTVSVTKEIRMGPFIDRHDLETKLKRAREFLGEGNKVRFVVKFAGREMSKLNIGRELLRRIIEEELKDVAKTEREMRTEGRRIVMVVSRIK